MEDRPQRRRGRALARRERPRRRRDPGLGPPLVQGAVAATAELDGQTVDQEAISNDRFTLVSLDALAGYGDDIFMEVKLWSRQAKELASESLYAALNQLDLRLPPRAALRESGIEGSAAAPLHPAPARRDVETVVEADVLAQLPGAISSSRWWETRCSRISIRSPRAARVARWR